MRSSPITIILTRSPFGSERARQGLDMALAFAAFEQPVTLVFRGEALSWLRRSHNTNALQQKNYTALIDELALYDIDNILVHSGELSGQKLALGDLRCPVRALTTEQLNAAIKATDKIWIY